MPVPQNTLTSYDVGSAGGLREDLIDVITNISPVETWFTSHSGTGKATNRYHEWLTDSLAAPGPNAVLEGSDALPAQQITPPVRLGNYCQILRKVIQISESEEAFTKAGRSSDMAYSYANKLKELAQDIEYALLINNASVAGNDGLARQLEGVLGWVQTNLKDASIGGVAQPFTVDAFNALCQMIWQKGGKPSIVLAGGFQKRAISAAMTAINRRDVAASKEEVTFGVNVYQSDYGRVAVYPHYIIDAAAPGTLPVLGDMKLWKKAWARPIKKTPLAKTGSSNAVMVEAELTLESRQEKGSGAMINLTQQ